MTEQKQIENALYVSIKFCSRLKNNFNIQLGNYTKKFQ